MPQIVPGPKPRLILFADGPRELPEGMEEYVSEPLVVDGRCDLTYHQWYHRAVQKPRAEAFAQRALEDHLRGHPIRLA